jgi:hypothetical protein
MPKLVRPTISQPPGPNPVTSQAKKTGLPTQTTVNAEAKRRYEEYMRQKRS